MSSDRPIEFTKENIDTYLKEVAKEYRKQLGKNMPAEMILNMKTVAGEKETRELLVEFEKKYPDKTKEANVDSIAENLQKKTSRATILADLRKKKTDNDSN